MKIINFTISRDAPRRLIVQNATVNNKTEGTSDDIMLKFAAVLVDMYYDEVSERTKVNDDAK